MGMPFVQQITTTGAQTPYIADFIKVPFCVSAAVVIASGAATYGVQYTLDDPNNPNITPNWFNDANLPPGQTANGVTNYAFPVLGIRINVTANTGTVRFIVLQGI